MMMRRRGLSVLALLMWAFMPVVFCQSQAPTSPSSATRELTVMVGKSVMIDSTPVIQRVSVASPELADAIIVSPHEVLINGRGTGATSLILWQEGGGRIFFNLLVRPDLQPTLQELQQNFPDLTLSYENNNLFLRGVVRDPVAAERALAIAATGGKVVNLLQVAPPGAEPQIMLKVRFADVDRSAQQQLGANIISTGALRTIGSTSTGQFSPPTFPSVGGVATSIPLQQPFNFNQLLNVFIFRPDLNLGATIEALQSRNILQILAEPNLVTTNNHEASFLAGGEFPFPTVQGGAAAGAVSIQFREFGVRLNFLPVVTPHNTIRVRVRPEVSSLDFSNALTISGFTVPALSTRRMDSEVDLADGQSFIIGGLLDNRVIENFNKIPGIGDIPILKYLFRSRQLQKNNSELMVLVTPVLVKPFEDGQAPPPPTPDRKFLELPQPLPATNQRVKGSAGGPTP